MKRTALFLLITLGFVGSAIIPGAKTKTGTTPLPPHSPAEKAALTKPISRALPQQTPSPSPEDSPHPMISAEPSCASRRRDDSLFGIYPLPEEEQSPAIVNDEKAPADLPDCLPPGDEIEVEPNVPSAGTPVFINFDDLPGNAEMSHRYPNVIFSSPGLSVFTFNHPGGDSPRSAPNTITRGTFFPTFTVNHFADLTADFTKPVDELIFYVTSCDDIFQIASLEFQYLDNNGVLRTGNDAIGGGGSTHPPIKIDFKTPGIKRVTRIKVYNITDTNGLTFDDFSFVIPETIPTAPGNLSSSVSNSQVILTWNASSGATSYRVKRSETSGGGYQLIATTASPGYLDSQVVKGHTYFYVVSAANGAGESGNSNQTSAFIPNPRPDPPAHLRAVPDEEAITLFWDPIPNATSYTISRTNTPPPTAPNENSPQGPQVPLDLTFNCSSSPCRFDDPNTTGDPLDSRLTYTYAVAGINSVGTGDSSSASGKPSEKPGCDWRKDPPKPVPNGGANTTLPEYLGWTVNYKYSERDGLETGPIWLHSRLMSERMSIPYYQITTCKTCFPTDSTRVNTRGELRIDGSSRADGMLYSRLIDHHASFLNDRISIEAIYGIDKIPGAPHACLKITQTYEFFIKGWDVPPRQEGPCEPSASIRNCTKFRPMVSYQFTPGGGTDYKMDSINIPQRLVFKVKHPEKKSTIAVTRDLNDYSGTLRTLITYNVLDRTKSKAPLRDEYWWDVIKNGKDQGNLDNFHQTYEPDFVEPEFNLLFHNNVQPGCPECVHMHWRWSSIVPEKSFGKGAPLIPEGSSQSLDIAVAVIHPEEDQSHPGDYADTIRPFEKFRFGKENRFHTLLWYSSTGTTNSDLFFYNPAWFLFDDPEHAHSPIQQRVDGAVVSQPAADGPTSVDFGDLFESGETTFEQHALTNLPALPPGFVALNNTGYDVHTTAVVAGPHIVHFSAQSVGDSDTFNKLRIFHLEADEFDPERGIWIDRTILPPNSPAPDFSSRTLAANPDRLGLFVIGKQVQVIPPSTDTANLSVSCSDSIDPVVAGNNLVYTINVTNNGPQTATNVALMDSLSPDVDFVSAVPGAGSTCKEIEGAVYCSLAPLSPGASTSLAITVQPNDGASNFSPQGKLITNDVDVRANQIDNNTDNNSVLQETTVLPNPNHAPSINITTPAGNITVIGPTDVALNANATDSDGSISKVEFFDNGALLGQAIHGSGNNYGFTIFNAPNGEHVIVARVTDNGGRQTRSEPVFIMVNSTATVNVVSPGSNSQVTPGSTVQLACSAVPPAGRTISKVQFLVDGISVGLGTLSGGLYRFDWTHVPAGILTIRAVATDGANQITVSEPVKITSNTPPTVSITTPTDGQVLPAASNITISAAAASAGGRIAKVEFFANGNLIGTARDLSTTKFSTTWRQPANGLYSLTAVAWDDLGSSTISSTITVGVNTPTPEPGEFIWFDDKEPQGAALFGNRDWWYWVDSNPAPFSGAKHHESEIKNGYHEHGFENAGFKLPVNADDKIYTYVFLSPGFKPQELMLGFKDQTGSWEHRAYWTDKAEGNWINMGADGTVSRHRMGPMPAEGRWVRLEIPAADVGLAGKTLTGMTFILYGGRAAFDRTGKSNRPTPTTPPPADSPWFDDALPGGAVPNQQDDVWTWVSSNPSPFSGTKAHKSFVASSGDPIKYRAHYFTGATQTMAVDPGDILYTYVYMDPTFTPDELVVGWHDGTDWHRAYWGSSWVLPGGRFGTESMRFMGGLPPAGTWVRLEIPASYVGLEGKRVSGMYFGMDRQGRRGLVTWDVSGKSALPPASSFEPLFATIPIHQFYNNDEGYTYFVSERQRSGSPLMNRWFVHTNQAPGTVPVFRMRNSGSHHFILTPNPGAAGPGWEIDPSAGDGGVPFYIYPNGGTAETTKLHSYRRGETHDYYYTIDPNDLAIDGRHYEGEIGWVHPTRSVMSPQANPIDDPKFFVRQHYSDFLSREPDAAGLAFWVGDYNTCPSNNFPCIDDKRNHISAAFFFSIEFQETGYFVYRYRKASFNVMPSRDQLFDDKAIVAQGLVVNAPGWQELLAANKTAFGEAWMQRPEFRAIFDGLSNEQYVDTLIANAGIDPAAADRNGLVNGLNSGTQTRATVLRAIVDTQAFIDREYNRAFVLMEYFGYLQRNPNDPPDNDFSGFNFWLNKLNEFNGNYLAAEMVKSFLVSGEYRGRFGQPAGPNSAATLTVGSNISAKVGNLAGKFSAVSTEGLMKVEGLYPWSVDQPPAGYTFFKNLAWKVTSTSNTSPPYTLTANIPWEVADAADFAKLRIFSREGNAWVDRTILAPDSPAPDFNNRTLSARVNTLSTVIVAHEGSTQTSLSITSPSNGATLNAPASISINTSAYDPDGLIDKVQFFNGNELIGEDASGPYSLSWTNVNAGTYTITARALDNMGVNVASATVNVVVNGPPIVVIMSPLAGTSLETPANIVFEVYASSSTGITKVEFFQGATKLGEDTTEPYTFSWNGVGVGSYNLTAKATNTANLTATSSTATITVVNTPPTVSITSPGNGASLGDAPANVVINANAADSHGIKNVEFFKNGVSLGIDTTAPYSFSWNNAPVGTFNLTAKATDNLDAVTISIPVSVTVTNAAPTVSITAPAPNAAYTAPASITINATAADNEGISKVEFFQNSTKLGEDTTAPYSFTWTNAGSGTYSLTARATDGQNATTTSGAVNVTVNAPPSITLTSPANGATYIAPAGVVLQASASDSDGAITQVEFFQNGASIGLDTSAPYSISWAHVPFGSYSLTARATDDRGATVTSNVVNITVNPASTVLITSPNNNAVFIGGSTVTISADATDSDGISKVEFFQGSTKLGEDTSSPYSYDWTDVAAGDYSLTARATDTLGEITDSAVMSISVLPQVKQFVGWSSIANGLDLGNGSLRKTSTGTWDFTATSLQKLLAGDGYFESTAANYNQYINLFGSDGSSRTLVIGTGGWASISENGQEVAATCCRGASETISPHAPGDRYRIEITNSVLRYVRYRSATREVMFTSTAALPAYPISLGLGMSPQNAEWQTTVLAQLTRKVSWSAIVNGVDLGNGSVRKTSTGTWDFSASAKQKLLPGDGYFESTASYWNHSINIGGSNGAGGSLVVGTGGWAAIYENGQEVANTSPLGNITPHAPGDRYRLEIANGLLRYVRYRSGVRAVLYTSTNPLPAYPLSFSLGSSFQNSEWQNTVIAQLSQTVSWSYINNGIDLGNGSVRKTSAGTWDFSAGSRQQLVYGTGYFESTPSYWNHSVSIGGSNNAGGALLIGTGSYAAIYENGQEVANTSPLANIIPHASGDRYRLEISRGKLRYVRYRSGARSILFTSANGLPAYAMAYSLGSSFQNSEWQNTIFSDNVPEHNDASFVSQTVPATMVPGQTYNVSITMRNTGASTWTPDGDYQLASENPPDNQRWGVNRVNLNSIVLPGADGTFSFTVTAPATGAQSFQWRMIQQGVERFGALTTNVNVQSANGAAPYTDRSTGRAGDTLNTPPFVALTAPGNGAIFEAPARIALQASAYDGDGTVAQVEFFQNGTSLGRDTSAPYSLDWTNVPAGSYSLTVVVTDDRGATMTSAPVTITVNSQLGQGHTETIGAYSGHTFHRRNSNTSVRADNVLRASPVRDQTTTSSKESAPFVLRPKNRRE
jgi:uncharacterized repeat protein (TIGR01451 family)